MPQNVASDQGYHCLQIVQPFFFLGISKSDSLTYIKSKVEAFNIQCGGVHSVYNGLNEAIIFKIRENIFCLSFLPFSYDDDDDGDDDDDDDEYLHM